MTFARSLDYGMAGESDIARWLRSRGAIVLPVYEKIISEGKGPQLFLPESSLIAPDMLVFQTGRTFWIEAKHKTAFSWHRITERWVTGIDLRHYADYCRVADVSDFPVWLLFLHEGGQAKDSPSDSPTGLWGSELDSLRENENHRHRNGGRGGMVYWARECDGGPLRLIATLDDLRAARAPKAA